MKSIHENILQEKRRFEKHLKALGVRFTNGRRIVFEEVMSAHGHFAAEDLIKQCRNNKRKVSRATIYRGLFELLESGIIRETAFGEKHQHFEHLYDEKSHHHARCIRCHAIFEFPDLNEDKIYRPILKKQGFQVLGHEMHFYGVCKTCQNKKNQ